MVKRSEAPTDGVWLISLDRAGGRPCRSELETLETITQELSNARDEGRSRADRFFRWLANVDLWRCLRDLRLPTARCRQLARPMALQPSRALAVHVLAVPTLLFLDPSPVVIICLVCPTTGLMPLGSQRPAVVHLARVYVG